MTKHLAALMQLVRISMFIWNDNQIYKNVMGRERENGVSAG